MSGETNLEKLLESMSPCLKRGEYVFVTTEGAYADFTGLEPLGTFREEEGLTLILPADKAEAAGWKKEPRFRMISLKVHSSLEAVGLTAAVSSKLAEAGISANVVAAYFHDHIFVPSRLADKALSSLTALSGKQP